MFWWICPWVNLSMAMKAEILDCPGTGVKGDCETFYVGVGNQTWALCRSSVLS